MPDSEAYKKLKEEARVARGTVAYRYKVRETGAEWVFKVFDKPPGLTIDHRGETVTFSEKELRDLMRGYLKGEYYMEVIYDPVEKAYIHVMAMINLGRFTWLPKYLYKTFLKSVCEALGIPYRVQMLEAVEPRPLTPKARVEFAEKKVWDVELERAKELKELLERSKREEEDLEKFFKAVLKK